MRDSTWNESVPKIVINDTMIFFHQTAISIWVISNHNSFRVLFDKIATGINCTLLSGRFRQIGYHNKLQDSAENILY